MRDMLLFGFGALAGVSSGLLGIGGGVILVPGLVLLFHFSQAEAQGTSLAVLIPPIGIFAALVYYQHGYVKLPVVGWIAVGFLVGAWCGAKLVPHVPETALRAAFGAVLLYVGFGFVLSAGGARHAAALPEGLAAVAAALVAWLLRRPRPQRTAAPPPGPDAEYHI